MNLARVEMLAKEGQEELIPFYDKNSAVMSITNTRHFETETNQKRYA